MTRDVTLLHTPLQHKTPAHEHDADNDAPSHNQATVALNP